MQHRKGQQEGLNVAVLVALLALFMIGYLILLPPKDREELLNQDFGDDNDGNNGASTTGDLLLSETPGIVRPFADERVRHKLTPIDLFVRDEPMTQDLVPSLFVSRDIFSDRKQAVNFNIDSKDSLDNAVLYFAVRDARGRLVINLNGREIFNDRLDGLGSIDLPVSLLASRNTITFSTSFALFGSNHYTLDDVKVRKQFNVRNVKASRTFVVDKNEFDRLTGARLNYFVSCISPSKESTELRIELNDKAFERVSLPCVGDEVTFDIDKDDIKEGRNTFAFSIDAGDFRFTDIEVEAEQEEKVFPTYNFVVDDDQIKDLEDDDVDAILKMSFLDDRKRKEAQIFLNGNRLFLDTTGSIHTKDISSFLEEGSNELKIIPVSQFEILNLEIRLE